LDEQYDVKVGFVYLPQVLRCGVSADDREDGMSFTGWGIQMVLVSLS